MIRTVLHRMHVERRLLAALFLWPQHVCMVDLEPTHFQSRQHGVLFEVLVEAGEALQRDVDAIPLLIATAKRKRVLGVFKPVGGIEEYVMTRMVPMNVERAEIPRLIGAVRECHHCGK